MVPNGLRPIGLSTSISRIKSCRGRWFPGNSVSHKGGMDPNGGTGPLKRYRPGISNRIQRWNPFLHWPGGSPYRNEELYFVSRRSSCKLHRHGTSTMFPPWVFDMLIYFGDMFHYVSLPPALQYCVMLVCPRGIRRPLPLLDNGHTGRNLRRAFSQAWWRWGKPNGKAHLDYLGTFYNLKDELEEELFIGII